MAYKTGDRVKWMVLIAMNIKFPIPAVVIKVCPKRITIEFERKYLGGGEGLLRRSISPANIKGE